MNTKERCINILHAAFTGLALTGMTMLTNGCDMIDVDASLFSVRIILRFSVLMQCYVATRSVTYC